MINFLDKNRDDVVHDVRELSIFKEINFYN